MGVSNLDAETDANFGIKVEISGDGQTILVGAANDGTNAGAAYYFSRSGNVLTEEQKITGLSIINSDLGHGLGREVCGRPGCRDGSGL